MSKSHHLTAKQKKLLQAVEEILFWKWDPLGINEIIIVDGIAYWPRDEYEAYVDGVFALLMRSKTTTAELAEHLNKLTNENMGVYPPAQEHDLFVANMLMTLKEN